MRGYMANRLASDFRHEPQLLRVLQRLFAKAPQGAFIDIGVNTGQTLLKVLAVDPNRRYLGIEPLLLCAHTVQQFILDNHLTNASVICVAAADRNAMLPFYALGGDDEMASLVPDGVRQETHVPGRIADELLAEIGIADVAVIKIDVEGAEARVIAGLRHTLADKRPVVIFEQLPNFEGYPRIRVSDERAKRNSEVASRVWQLLGDAGYSISQLDDNGDEHRISGFDLDDPAGYVGRDYIAYPPGGWREHS